MEAQKRLKELQKQERERLKQKDHRDKYIQLLRNQRFTREASNPRNISALDLDVDLKSRIPRPAAEKKLVKIPSDHNIKGPSPSRPLNENQSKIPKFGHQKDIKKDDCLPWKKGDLLDSLDLSSTNMKKMFQNRPKLCDSPGASQADKSEWLKENFRESINEWAPKKIEPVELKPSKRVIIKKHNKINIQEKIEEIKEVAKGAENVDEPLAHIPKAKHVRIRENPIKKIPEGEFISVPESNNHSKRYENIENTPSIEIAAEKSIEIIQNAQKVQKDVGKKSGSRFVGKFKAIPEKDDFLENELQCVMDEEAKLQASLARLDLKSLRLKHQAELAELDAEAKQLENSIKIAQEEEKNKNKNVTADFGGNMNKKDSVSPKGHIDNEDCEKFEKFSEFNEEKKYRNVSPTETEITNQTSYYPDNGSVFSAHPYPKPRQLPDARSACSEDEKKENYGRKEVHRIGAVYNEISARSGRYSNKNPAPQYALPKSKNKEPISFRKPPPGPDYTLDVVKVNPDVVKINPNIDVKSLFSDL